MNSTTETETSNNTSSGNNISIQTEKPCKHSKISKLPNLILYCLFSKKRLCIGFEKNTQFFQHSGHKRKVGLYSLHKDIFLCENNKITKFTTCDHELALNLCIMCMIFFHCDFIVFTQNEFSLFLACFRNCHIPSRI